MIRFLLPGAAALLLLAAVPAGAADLTRAARNYDAYCAQCHGVNRDGKGVNTAAMAVQPRDHTDAKGMESLPDDQIFKAIKDGGLGVNKSVLMPAWGSVMSDAEIKDLVAYLRQVCKCGPGR
ncbi:MAG TPA: cytochrome c [Azospirillaceae bacterium]|nr:cytochrome c [Azospirillaceae bacterium]